MNWKRVAVPLLTLLLAGAAAKALPWEELNESDWLYAVATRFALVDGHRVHYPTPTAELAKLLAGRQEAGALRQLADARLALGDRKGAVDAIQAWADAEAKGGAQAGAAAWAEAARWAASHSAPDAAFKAAEKALPGLGEDERRALADERIGWAEQHPELADPIALRQARAALFPQDARLLEDWVRALEKAGRLPEAGQALAGTQALPPERRLLMRSDLLADHQDFKGAFQVLDEAVAQSWSADFRKAYARRVDAGAPGLPATWRGTLENRYDASALLRLATYFQGQERGDAAAGLLTQMDRRYGASFGRADHLLMARLHSEIDAVPEAFRQTLAAAQLGDAKEQLSDLAALSHLALRAGGRPLAWGGYNDESYRWAASIDRTPGFWTGGLSFFLTGQDWKEAMDHLESEALPARTFAVARALADELAKRDPKHPEVPGLKLAIMTRYQELGDGPAALALLPQLESAPPAVADEARRVALLAARQTEVPLGEELRLLKARLAYLAPKGSRPNLQSRSEDENSGEEDGESRPWARLPREAQRQSYKQLLDESLERTEQLDRSHRASLDLALTELDRLPDAEGLWLDLADRLGSWNLDDELGPRLDGALKRFSGTGIWDKAARWYARRSYHAQLRKLGEDLVARFRGSALFDRATASGSLAVPEQPQAYGRVRMVEWADWVRLRALERFPHSPRVFQEAQRLLPASEWQKALTDNQNAVFGARERVKSLAGRTVVPDTLLEERRWAILFVDPAQREAFFASAMHRGVLEAELTELESRKDRTPVEDQLLFEGWARLSQFERAIAPAERLASAYPGDGDLADRVLSLHRSLNGLEASHAEPARALVARTAPALEDPNGLWTSLGELEEDRGRPDAAIQIWKHLLDREPRSPERISELSTLLWDYNHDAEALQVLEEGRQRLGRPRFMSFEAGVLRENRHDLEGAIHEYLEGLRAEERADVFSNFESDQRSLRRLAQLLSRERVYRLVAQRIQGLRPGNADDEHALSSLLLVSTITTPAPGQDWDADDWIDGMDQPNDPQGREARAEHREDKRPKEHDAIHRIGDLMLEKAQAMVPKASAQGFLDLVEEWSKPLTAARWKADPTVRFQSAIMARRAELAPSQEERIQQEMARADFLASKEHKAEAEAVWAALQPRIGALPEGTVRMRAEAARAAYLERTEGAAAAGREWERLGARYPWSLGLLEDRLAFLDRTGQGASGRALLESVIPKAAEGHREALLQRLTQDSLAASELPRARRAVEQLLAEDQLDETRRLAAVQLLARLSWREDPAWDAFALAKAQKDKLKPELQADLYRQLAQAADLEQRKSTALWIEALNRRTERDWLQAAARSAQRMGTDKELLGFFEKQLERSPRDVRWAVAVRDLRRAFHDVEGAIAAAKAAVAVRPEEEILWREASEILVRADRVGEAADYLEGWNKPRAADEQVAGWRSRLYAQAGQADKAFAVEKAALAAYAKGAPQEQDQLAERRGRAAVRLLEEGHPELALRLVSARSEVKDLPGTRIPGPQQCQIALLLDQYPRLLEALSEDSGRLQSAADYLRDNGRMEQLEAVQAFLLARLQPPQNWPDAQALNLWWPFVQRAGLEPQMRLGLAQRYLGEQPGPWQAAASARFLAWVGEERMGPKAHPLDDRDKYSFRDVNLNRLWARDLARRDEPEALLAFMEPHWQELLGKVLSGQGIGPDTPRLPWAGWMDDGSVLEAWARAAAQHPEKVRELGELMGKRQSWDYFWALAARAWRVEPLLAVAPQESRTAWFHFWEQNGAPQTDPLLLARRKTVENVEEALGRLVQGAKDAAEDPLLVKLRGPQSVGEVLGRDSRWVWAEFKPRRNAKGELIETGDDRIIGQGVDEGRLPGALWGERPGDAWYVLEALVRYRKGDASAPLLPLDAPQKGSETPRALLAIRMARAMGNLELAQELVDRHPGAARDRSWVEARISLLLAENKKDEAQQALRAELLERQARMTEEEFRWLSTCAEDWGLPPALDLLDAQQPVGPAFLAYLQDRRPEVAPRFHTADPIGFKAALAARWDGREAQLDAEQIRYWLRELWAAGGDGAPSAALPFAGLPRLGGLWPKAGAWLSQLDVQDRREALEALRLAQDPQGDASRFFALLAAQKKRGKEDDVARRLGLRVRLARGENDKALALVDGLLAELRKGQALGFDMPDQVGSGASGDGEEEAQAAPEEDSGNGQDAIVKRLEAWLQPFREAKSAGSALATAEERVRGFLKERRDEGRVSAAAWKLAFRLAPDAEQQPLAQELDAAWFRGEVEPSDAGLLADALAAKLPAEASRWLARWPREGGLEQARSRALLLQRLKRGPEGARALFIARKQSPWGPAEELKAFQAWRRLGAPLAPEAPAAWSGALPLWSAKGADLDARMKAHPFDALSARSALMSPAPADEDGLFRAALALPQHSAEELQDLPLLRLKAARGLLARSGRAAELALAGARPEELERLMVQARFKTADINAALADLARIAAKADNAEGLRAALKVLADRRAPNAKALRAELKQDSGGPVQAYRVVNGRPAPIRPRDLDWSLLANVMKAEAAR